MFCNIFNHTLLYVATYVQVHYKFECSLFKTTESISLRITLVFRPCSHPLSWPRRCPGWWPSSCYSVCCRCGTAGSWPGPAHCAWPELFNLDIELRQYLQRSSWTGCFKSDPHLMIEVKDLQTFLKNKSACWSFQQIFWILWIIMHPDVKIGEPYFLPRVPVWMLSLGSGTKPVWLLTGGGHQNSAHSADTVHSNIWG